MIEALLAGLGVACLSLLGVLFFGKKVSESPHIHRLILPLAIGVFLGVVFFELIPETIEGSHEWGPVAILFGFLGFYLLSHLLNTFHHHHRDGDDCVQNGARMLLIGDSIHNIADGVVIATAFMINPAVGLITTLGIALHEIPQEIAEFGVLIQSGYSRKKAALYNMLSASSIFIGILLTYLFVQSFEEFLFILTGIAAGNLLYVATTDLIPEVLQEHRDHFKQTFLATLIGAVTIAVLITYTHEYMGHAHLSDDHGDIHTEEEPEDR